MVPTTHQMKILAFQALAGLVLLVKGSFCSLLFVHLKIPPHPPLNGREGV